jgi:serine/threonine protein kinase
MTPAAAAALLGLVKLPGSAAELETAWQEALGALRKRLPPDNFATQDQHAAGLVQLSSARAMLLATLPVAGSITFPVQGGKAASTSMISPGYSPSMLADMGSTSMIRSAGGLPAVPAAGDVPMVSLNPGTVLGGRYEIIAQLGAGGMGVVYTAIDRLKRNEEIAIKVLSPALTANVAAKERFLNEAIIATSLNHPGIVKVHTPEQQGDLIFITMEKLEGRSLRAVLEECLEAKVQLKLPEVLRIATALCDALIYAHSMPQPIVHRDIKPENIFICSDASVRLMDFGLAQKSSGLQLTAVATAMGTADYMAPEQRTDARSVDHRADQYAFAVTLYEMIAGHVPQGSFTEPKAVRPGIPAGLSDAIMRGLSHSPAKRFPNMQAFRAQMQSKEQWSSRLLAPENRDMLATAGLVCLLLGGGLFFLLLRHPTGPGTVASPAGTSSSGAANPRPGAKQARPPESRPEPKALGGLSVTTTPPGAEVTLGSQYVATSPARFTNVPVGRYPMRVFLKDYAEVSQEVEIVAGNFVTREVTLEPRLKITDPKDFFEETLRLMRQAAGYESTRARGPALQAWKEAQVRLKLLSVKFHGWQPLAVAQRLQECEASIQKLQ